MEWALGTQKSNRTPKLAKHALSSPLQVVRKPEEHSEITYVAKKLDDEPSGNAELKVVKGDVTDYDSCIEALKVLLLSCLSRSADQHAR